MKKFIALLLAMAALSVGLMAGCENINPNADPATQYYDTTFIVTGEALPVEWNKATWDNGYKHLSSGTNKPHASRYLMEQYFSEIKWDEPAPANVGEAIAKVDHDFSLLYEHPTNMKNMTFSLTQWGHLSLTITYPTNTSYPSYTIMMFETADQFKSVYPSGIRTESGNMTPTFSNGSIGYTCHGVVNYRSTTDQQMYQRIVTFSTRRFEHETLGEVTTIDITFPVFGDNMYCEFVSIEQKYVLSDASGRTAISLSARPKVNIIKKGEETE